MKQNWIHSNEQIRGLENLTISLQNQIDTNSVKQWA